MITTEATEHTEGAEAGGRKKRVQARGKPPRSQSPFFAAFAPLAQVLDFYSSRAPFHNFVIPAGEPESRGQNVEGGNWVRAGFSF